jgi:hypothetical protein
LFFACLGPLDWCKSEVRIIASEVLELSVLFRQSNDFPHFVKRESLLPHVQKTEKFLYLSDPSILFIQELF